VNDKCPTISAKLTEALGVASRMLEEEALSGAGPGRQSGFGPLEVIA
jgi:hypothetical protein